MDTITAMETTENMDVMHLTKKILLTTTVVDTVIMVTIQTADTETKMIHQ